MIKPNLYTKGYALIATPKELETAVTQEIISLTKQQTQLTQAHQRNVRELVLASLPLIHHGVALLQKARAFMKQPPSLYHATLAFIPKHLTAMETALNGESEVSFTQIHPYLHDISNHLENLQSMGLRHINECPEDHIPTLLFDNYLDTLKTFLFVLNRLCMTKLI